MNVTPQPADITVTESAHRTMGRINVTCEPGGRFWYSEIGYQVCPCACVKEHKENIARVHVCVWACAARVAVRGTLDVENGLKAAAYHQSQWHHGPPSRLMLPPWLAA